MSTLGPVAGPVVENVHGTEAIGEEWAGTRVPGGVAAPPGPLDIGASGADVYLRPAGITQALGAVASWDSEGGTNLRFEASDPAYRPAAETAGAYTVGRWDGSDDQIVSDTAIQILRPYTIGLVVAVNTWVGAGTYIWSPDTPIRNYISAIGGTPNYFRWDDGTVLLTSTTNVAAGEYASLILRSDTEEGGGASGTSYLLLNGTQEDTDTVGARSHTSTAPSIGARIDGSSHAAFDLVDFALWSGEYLTDDQVTALNDWHVYVKGRL